MATLVSKTLGSSPTRDYQTFDQMFTAWAAINAIGDDVYWEVTIHMDDDDGFVVTQLYELDNTNTDATHYLHLKVDPASNYLPGQDDGKTGARVLVKLDTTATGSVGFIHVKRETAFKFTGPIGIFVTSEDDLNSPTDPYLFWISGDGSDWQRLYCHYLRANHASEVYGFQIEYDAAWTGTPSPSTTRIANCIIDNQDNLDTDEGFSIGMNIAPHPSGVINNLHIQHNTFHRCNNRGILNANSDQVTGYQRYVANVAIDCGPTPYLSNGFAYSGPEGGSQPTALYNVATDGSGNTNPDDPTSFGFDAGDWPQPGGAEMFVNRLARDLRLRVNSPARNFADGNLILTVAEAVSDDFTGSARVGPFWDSGAVEGGHNKDGSAPTEKTVNVGRGYLVEHPEQWLRGTKGSLVWDNRREIAAIYAWPEEEYTFDNDVSDDPEVLLDTSGWSYVNPTFIETGDPQEVTSTPWNFASMWLIETTAAATGITGVSADAGTMAPEGEWNCMVATVYEGTSGNRWRFNIRNATDSQSHVIDFDWVSGIPTAVSIPSDMRVYVRGPYSVGGTDYFHVQVNLQSAAGDVGDSRSVFIYPVASGSPWASQSLGAGFVRVVSRAADVEIGYCRGDAVGMDDYTVVTDQSRYRDFAAADGEAWDQVAQRGVAFKETRAGFAVKINEAYAKMRGIKVIQENSTSSERGCVLVGNRRSEIREVVGELKNGNAETNPSEILRFMGNSDDVMVANLLAVGSGSGLGANRGVVADAKASGTVLNATIVDITGGTAAEGAENEGASQVRWKNCIVVDCDTDMDVDEDFQTYCITSDATADGVGSQINVLSSDLFEDKVNGDYRNKKGSPAINAGDHEPLDLSIDISGRARYAPWECGVYDGFAFAPQMPAIVLGNYNRLITIWDIIRWDGVAYQFTDNNAPYEYEGQVYTPAEGIEGSAQRYETGGREANYEIMGPVSLSAIKDDDLRSGRFQDARLIARVVDWKYPMYKPVLERGWRILQIEFSEESWRCDVVGITSKLHRKIGGTVGRTCPYKLGELGTCNANILSDTQFGLPITGVTSGKERKEFVASATPGGYGDRFFAFGELVVESGNNKGLRGVVKKYVGASKTYTLQTKMPHAFEVGDVVRVEPGCDKLFSTCEDDFSNEDNFGGERDTPNTDKALNTPTQ